MIAFARANRAILSAVFCIAALSVLALSTVNHFWPEYTGESWGWMMLFACLPWSVMAAAVPGWFGVIILALGFGVNVVIVTTVGWYVISWWLKTLRFGDDA